MWLQWFKQVKEWYKDLRTALAYVKISKNQPPKQREPILDFWDFAYNEITKNIYCNYKVHDMDNISYIQFDTPFVIRDSNYEKYMNVKKYPNPNDTKWVVHNKKRYGYT